MSLRTLGSLQLLCRPSSRHPGYTRRVPLPGPVDTTIDWLFATGRDHPLWAVTFDASPSPADSIEADTRAPYGDLQWDGGANADVDGVGWGDRYRFRTTTSPVTLQSGWDYSQANTIPHVLMWSNAADAEMGAVQTQTMAQRDAGGYGFYVPGQQRCDGPMRRTGTDQQLTRTRSRSPEIQGMAWLEFGAWTEQLQRYGEARARWLSVNIYADMGGPAHSDAHACAITMERTHR